MNAPKVDLRRVQLIWPGGKRVYKRGFAGFVAFVVKRVAVGIVLAALLLLALGMDSADRQSDTPPSQTTHRVTV